MNCTLSRFTYPSSNAGSIIQAYCYQDPSVQTAGILQIVHGMCEDFLNYDEFSRFLASKGFLVVGNDHLGHGNSVQPSEVFGYFSDKNGHQKVVEDVVTLQRTIKKQHPTLPYFVLGHSMGSFITRSYLIGHSHEIDGVIISGTGDSNPLLPIGLGLTTLIGLFRGKTYRSELVYKMTGVAASYEDSYNPGYDWLTKDHEIIDKYQAKSDTDFKFTVSAYHDMFLLIQEINKKSWGSTISKQLPIYFFSGDQDPVGEFGKGVRKVVDRLKRFEFDDLTLKLYPNGRHEMLKEVNRQEVFQDLLNWLQAHSV